MNAMKTRDTLPIPLHHFPSTIGMTSGSEISTNWLLALKEIRELAAESRRRRIVREHGQTGVQAKTSRAA